MAIDKISVPNSVWISIPKDKKLLDLFGKKSDEYSGEDDEGKELLITDELGCFNTSEYFFDESNNEIMYSGELVTPNGKVYISITLPLSDEILIDLLGHSVKKLNKLKNAMESLK